VTLLDGVTGSGKTEVYFEAVADAIRAGRQSLILMPEIALTAQFLDRFAARFGVRPAEWHSEVSPRKRARTWKAVADGEVSVVVGARSALFLPYADLGLIIVDEEHDQAYKQEDGVRYHARDMAVVRGHIARIPVVLSSATPSLETEVNARRGRYRRLALPERFGGQRMPSVEAIDLRHERPPPGRFIAPTLAGAVQTAIGRGEQALLFLNRRGYAPLTLCRACGFRFSCPNCDAWLVDHRFRRSSSATIAASPCRIRPTARTARRRIPSPPSAPASSAWKRKCANCFRARACWCCPPISSPPSSVCAKSSTTSRKAVRHCHRHAARRQGPSFPEAQPRRRHRCRSRLGERRSARRRTHLSAPASGGRPRRPRRRHRPGICRPTSPSIR
jgi:hypothetical protein